MYVTLNDKKYVVTDEQGTLYPLNKEIHHTHFETFTTIRKYAEELAQINPSKRFEVWGLQPIVAFTAEAIITEQKWNQKDGKWDK